MSGSATVTVADILELRADGLTEDEIWSLLCQAVQTLQDLFLSVKLTDGRTVPFVSPHTLAISSKGRVVISLVHAVSNSDEHYLAPEYVTRGHRTFLNREWEKMWIYSLGRSLMFSLKAAANSSSLIVLKYMTMKDPATRASLMALLNIISDHCKTNLPMKPFNHLLMEMYREVFGTPPQCLLPVDAAEFINVGTKEIFEPDSSIFDVGKKTSSRTSSTGGSSESSRSVPVKRNPVQRAPSRLYRGPSAASVRILPSACIGPEFVVRGMEAAKTVHIGDTKPCNRRTLTVILLTGQRLRVICDPNTLCGKVFEVLVQVEEIEDNFMFGLASLINGDFVFLPSEMKLHKIAPSGWKGKGKDPSFFLYIRIKFFLPSLRGVKNPKTRHFMYLQLRRSLLEQQIKCELNQLLTLGGLALQVEFGNYDKDEHGTSSYFLLEHYLPEELIDERPELEARLQENHKSRYGLDPARAEEIFVAQAQRLPEYGSHHYTALWVRKSVNIPMWVTVNPQGVYLYEKKKSILDRKIHEAFIWRNIQGLNCNENYFRLVPRDVFGQKIACYKLRMDNKKSFFLFRLASLHHRFFLKLRIELSPLHALSQEFGVVLKKDNKNSFHLENKPRGQESIESSQENGNESSASCLNFEERQNKENENPMERREKRVGVKMGVSAFHSKLDISGIKLTPSEASAESFEAYVIDSSINDKFSYDIHESIPTNLAAKIDDFSWEEERILTRVRLSKDKYGSFGLEIVEGSNGGLFVENVLKSPGDDEIEVVRRGDQLVSVNGICLLNLNYAEALNLLKTTGEEIEILLSQNCSGDTRQKPLEREYLRNIRYETANETENFEGDVTLTNGSLVSNCFRWNIETLPNRPNRKTTRHQTQRRSVNKIPKMEKKKSAKSSSKCRKGEGTLKEGQNPGESRKKQL